MTDIVETLRDAAKRKWPGEADQQHSLFGQAATEIETLRKALRYVVSVYIVSDESWDRSADTERAIARIMANGANA